MSKNRNIKSTIEYNKRFLNKNSDPKYEKWMNSIIDKAKLRTLDKNCLYEKHHIIPKCIGGTDSEDNLVYLTIKEHVLVHKLLHEIYPNCPGIALAINAMMLEKPTRKEKYFSLREITFYREEARKALIGRKATPEQKANMSKAQKGHIPWNKGKTMNDKQKSGIVNRWKNITEEERLEFSKKISQSSKGRKAHNRVKIKGPDGTIYDSIKEASIKLKVSDSIIRWWMKNKPEKGFKRLT